MRAIAACVMTFCLAAPAALFAAAGGNVDYEVNGEPYEGYFVAPGIGLGHVHHPPGMHGPTGTVSRTTR